jgi:hypothetical protein
MKVCAIILPSLSLRFMDHSYHTALAEWFLQIEIEIC